MTGKGELKPIACNLAQQSPLVVLVVCNKALRGSCWRFEASATLREGKLRANTPKVSKQKSLLRPMLVDLGLLEAIFSLITRLKMVRVREKRIKVAHAVALKCHGEGSVRPWLANRVFILFSPS